MYCSNCGKKLTNEAANFCFYCGAQVVRPAVQPEPAEVIKPEETGQTTLFEAPVQENAQGEPVQEAPSPASSETDFTAPTEEVQPQSEESAYVAPEMQPSGEAVIKAEPAPNFNAASMPQQPAVQKRKYNGTLWMILNIVIGVLCCMVYCIPFFTGTVGAIFGGLSASEYKKNNQSLASTYGMVSMILFIVGASIALLCLVLIIVAFATSVSLMEDFAYSYFLP